MRSIKIKQQTIQFHSFMHKLPSEESIQDTTTANSSQTAKKKEMQLIKHNKDCKTYIQKTEYKSHRILVANIRASTVPNPFNLDSQYVFLIIFCYYFYLKKNKINNWIYRGSPCVVGSVEQWRYGFIVANLHDTGSWLCLYYIHFFWNLCVSTFKFLNTDVLNTQLKNHLQ